MCGWPLPAANVKWNANTRAPAAAATGWRRSTARRNQTAPAKPSADMDAIVTWNAENGSSPSTRDTR
jgi:hypothetical protein